MGKDMEMAGHGDTRETIVIVGGGICGLAVALALHRFSIYIHTHTHACVHAGAYFIFKYFVALNFYGFVLINKI